MTRQQEAFYDMLNLCGSDVPDEVTQSIIDEEHKLLDPNFVPQPRNRQLQAQC